MACELSRNFCLPVEQVAPLSAATWVRRPLHDDVPVELEEDGSNAMFIAYYADHINSCKSVALSSSGQLSCVELVRCEWMKCPIQKCMIMPSESHSTPK